MEDIYGEALKLILQRKRTKKEITDKLLQKGFDLEKAKEAVRYYSEAGYVDNRDYAARYAHDAAKIKGYGRWRIELELKNKGVEEEIISEVLDGIDFDLEGLMKKRFPPKGRLDARGIKKIADFYYRRGFSSGEIADTIRKLYKDDGGYYD